jgi:hypothetical protein
VKVIAWGIWVTTTVRETCGAAVVLLVAAELAAMVTLPTVVYVIVEPSMLAVPLVTLYVTGSPLLAIAESVAELVTFTGVVGCRKLMVLVNCTALPLRVIVCVALGLPFRLLSLRR